MTIVWDRDKIWKRQAAASSSL